MKSPNITRRDLLAALVGAALLALALFFSGLRWQIVPTTTGGPYVYQFDRWTGRAWLWYGDELSPVATRDESTTPAAATVRGALAFGVVFAVVVGGAVVLSRRNS